MNDDSRVNEWYVPKFGPKKFRIFIGLLFLPYTGMCVSFVILGGLLSQNTNFERLLVISIIYFISLGIAAHIADSLGSKKVKPWGNLFSKKQSWVIITTCLFFSYLLGFYYIFYYTPLLLIIGILESFFLFAYNFELFNGFFHKDFWFAISWGMVPFIAGFVVQTNSITYLSLLISLIPFILSYTEIKLSRPYKIYKRNKINSKKTKLYERYLKILSLGTVCSTLMLFCLKILIF
ncbi:MAG: hypothetical protein H0X03_05570 [Nitrosopumilus sp.]|nr:hypothetical protein [Nitrosopumilus sp.]